MKFVNGLATIRKDRKVIAKVYYRPEYFAGTNINYSKKYNLELTKLGVSKEFDDFKELEKELNAYI